MGLGSWFADLFGTDQADEVEMRLLVGDQENPFSHLTLAEMAQVWEDRETLRSAEPTYNCETCGNTRRTECPDCEEETPGQMGCGSCDGSWMVSCRWCRGSGERSGEVCEDCAGNGWITCMECQGSGLVDCPTCLGDGWVDCPVECWARRPDGRFYS